MPNSFLRRAISLRPHMIRWFTLAWVTLFASPLAVSQTCTHTWLGGDGHFNDDASWDIGLAPGETDVACITAPGTYTVSLSDVRSAAERDRFGAERVLAGLVLGGESGTQTLRMTESAFDNEGYEELGVDELVILGTGRFEMPGGTLLDSTAVVNEGAVALGGETASPRLLDVEVISSGTLAIGPGTTRLKGRLVNENGGELRLAGPAAEVDMERDAEVVNRGLLVSSGQSNSLGERAGVFSNEGGRVFVESGELMIQSERVLLEGGEYDAAAGGRFVLEGFGVAYVEGELQGNPEGDIVFDGVELRGIGALAVLRFGGRGLRVGEISGILRNEGLIQASSFLMAGGRFTNAGRMVVSEDRLLVEGTLINESGGTLALGGSTVAQVLIIESGQFVNRGRVVAESGTTNQVVGAFTNKGGRLEAEGGDLVVSGAPLRLEQGTYVASSGRTLRLGGASFSAGGVLRGEGEGTWILGFSSTVRQSLNEIGVFDFGGAGLIVETGEFSGRWINLGRMVQTGGGYRDGTFENRGTLEWNGPVVLREAILKNEADASLSLGVDGTVRQSGSLLTNRGLIVKSGGEGTTMLEPVVVNAEGGEIRASSGTLAFTTLTDAPGARYSGTGTLALPPNFIVSGAIAPGDSANSTGVLTWAGPLLASSSFTLDVDLNGLAPGEEHDQLVVDGDVSLSGALRAAVSSAFSPEVGTSFEVLRAISLSGQFASSSLADGLEIRTSTASVDIAVVAPVSTESSLDAVLDADLAILGNPSRQPVLRLTVPREDAVQAEVLDVRGRRVAQVVEATLPRGIHEVSVPYLPAGVYVVRASVGGETFVRRLTVVQ